MAEALALRYRPRVFTDLVGQKPVEVILRQMVLTNRVPPGLLFGGASGTGKTTTARILAAALNCEATDQRSLPCAACPSDKAIYDGTSLDVTEIDAASNGLVDDIRALRDQILYAMGGRHRVIILDEAHSMSSAAFDALLKTLEEPPPATVFLLLTTEPNRLPKTVLTRLMPFVFRRLTRADIATRLQHICATEQLTVAPDLLAALAEQADGSLRDAVMSLDQIVTAGITTLDAYTELVGYTDPAPALAIALARGDAPTAYALADEALNQTGAANAIVDALVACYRDVLVLHAGGSCSRQDSTLEARKHLASLLEPPAVVAAMKILWELKTRFRAVDNQRAGLDLAIALIADTRAKLGSATPLPAAPPRKLNLKDMKAMRP